MKITAAPRLQQLPPYLFAQLNAKKAELQARGTDIIDLGVGDPDLPTPPHIIQALRDQAGEPQNHCYPTYEGMLSFRQAVAGWYRRRFGVILDPQGQVLALMGAKDGLAHVCWALLGQGDRVLCPDPGYPVYAVQAMFAGAEAVSYPVTAANKFLPDIEALPTRGIRAIFLCYPSNPTGAVAELDFYQRMVDWALRNGIMILNDGIYSEIAFDGFRPPSIMQAQGAEECAVEFHSLSKTYNMTGWRIGMAVGNREMLSALLKVKTNTDSGVFQAVQYAGIAALDGSQQCVADNCRTYQERRDILAGGLRRMGLDFQLPRAAFYLWFQTPGKMGSIEFADRMLEKSGVMVVPGVGFGRNGEGYLRAALTVSAERMGEAVARMAKAL
jgi:LL-diaminopimelate aminotransferase